MSEVAALALGLTDVPVTVRTVEDEQTHELLLIDDNTTGRQLTTSQMARSVKRIYEIRGVKHGGNHQGSTVESCKELTGLSSTQVKVYRTLADLIPELSALLDAKKISQKVAYQLAQMEPEDQQAVAQDLELKVQAKWLEA